MEASFSRLSPPAPPLVRRLKPNTGQAPVALIVSRVNDTQILTPEFTRARKTCFCLTD
jgi:hypothetical protein